MKIVLQIWYSNKNFGFRKIESNLASKIEFEIWKYPIFASFVSNCLTRYEQILSGCSLWFKNALNFIRLIWYSTTVVTLRYSHLKIQNFIRRLQLPKIYLIKYFSSPKWHFWSMLAGLHTDRSGLLLSRVLTKNYSTAPRVPMGIWGVGMWPQNLDLMVWCSSIKV